MKQKWIRKYTKAKDQLQFDSTILTAFNANIDCSENFENLSINLEKTKPEKIEAVNSEQDLKKILKYCKENSSNQEASIKNFKPNIEGKNQLGGQAGIMANFISNLGQKSIVYTPFLSEQLASHFNENIVYPVVDDSLKLKKIEDVVNSDRTKKNHIIEFKEESCRLILSDSLRGFGTYFRKSIEEKMTELNSTVDRMIFSGFHDTDGNVKTKLKKSKSQLRSIESSKHLEFVSKNNKVDKLMLDEIVPEFESIGLDEEELKIIGEKLDIDTDNEISLGYAFEVSKKLIEKADVQRVHIHTLSFHTVIADESYPIEAEKIRQGILFGSLAAVSMAEKGSIPKKDEIKFKPEKMHINIADDLEHFEDFFNLENFVEEGIARIDGYKIVAAPTIIHENPKRLVGLGDLISSGAFTAEIN